MAALAREAPPKLSSPRKADKPSQETQMLSPHEFATLMLLKDSPDLPSLDNVDLEALLNRQLVTLEQLASGQQRPLITNDGRRFLNAVARLANID